MQVYEAQIIGIVVLFCVTTGVGLLPSVLMRRRRIREWSESSAFSLCLSVANSLAAGVFMEICFLSLIPEVQELFQRMWQELDVEVEYPLAEALVLLGFFLILAVENLALWLQRRGQKLSNMGMQALSTQDIAVEMTNHATGGSSHTPLNDREHCEAEVLNGGPNGDVRNGSDAKPAAKTTTAENHHGHSHGALLENQSGESSSLRFLMLLAAISLHSLLEGLAVGLQESIPTVVNLFLAILIHETLVALAIGIKVAQRKTTVWRSLRMVCMFTLMIPLGIGIGISLGTVRGATGFGVSGTCQALAAGVFLHVTFMELVPEELQRSQNALVSISCMLMGFLGMSLIAYFIEEGLHHH